LRMECGSGKREEEKTTTTKRGKRKSSAWDVKRILKCAG